MALYPSQMRMLQRPQAPQPAQAAPQSSPGGSLSGYDSIQNYQRWLIDQGGKAGAFGPSYLRNLLRRSAFRRAGNRRRRGDVLAGLQGLDPMQRRFQALEDERSASGQLSGALNEADIQGGSDYQNYLRHLLGNERGGEERYRVSEQEKADRRSANKAAAWSGAGQLLGTVATGGWG